MAYHFLKQFAEEYNRRVLKFHQQAEAYLLNYAWPGNVRELKNIIAKLVLFSEGEIISVSEVMEAFQNNLKPASVLAVHTENDQILDLKSALENFEKHFIIQTLNNNNWRVDATANSLGIDRSSLFRKRTKFNIANGKGTKA